MINDLKIENFNDKFLSDTHNLDVEIFGSNSWSLASFKYELKLQQSINLIATINNYLVGYVFSNSIYENTHINNLAVSPNYRNMHIGYKLMSSIINISLEKKANIFNLEVRKSNISAINFYKKLGFIELFIRKDFYVKPSEDAIIMELIK